ncbi:MAG: hypothetical protein OEY85_04075 [Rhodospirillales bacterium]|nr:hypothetical protein [Rhodospirillales bacterium]
MSIGEYSPHQSLGLVVIHTVVMALGDGACRRHRPRTARPLDSVLMTDFAARLF